MHITTTTEDLLHALQTVYRAVPPRTPLPILTGIFFEAVDDSLYLTATDLEQGIRTHIPATVKTPGTAVLPAREITELARRLSNVPTVQLQTDPANNTTVVSYAQSELTLHGFSPDEYPALPDVTGETLINLPQALLRKMLRQVLYAVSQDEYRPVFTGVLFEFLENRLNLVATDIHRLALRTTLLEHKPNKLINVVVPGKTLNEVAKLLVDEDSYVSIYVTENQMFFFIDKVQIVTRLLAGSFPNYNVVIPKNITCDVKVNTRELLEAVDRALLLANAKRQTVLLQLKGNTLTVSFNAETGRIREDLLVESSGKDMDVRFNGRYLIDALKSMDTEQIHLQLTGPSTPAVIKPSEGDEYISVLVPAIPQ